MSIDNVTFTGCLPATPTPPATNTPPYYAPLSLVINEVAWSGTAYSSSDQWVELYNPGSVPVNLSNWVLDGVNPYYSAGHFGISLSGTVPAGGYFVLAQNPSVFQNTTIVDKYNNALSLANPYQYLQLIGPSGAVVDTANYSVHSCAGFTYLSNYCWPAGSASRHASMERYYPPGGPIPRDGPTAWVTYADPNPVTIYKDHNGNTVQGTPGADNWALSVTETPSPIPTHTPKPTATFAPTPIPSVVINEILPRPGSDWNGDGTVNVYDEFIEIENLGPGIVDLTSWKLDVLPASGSSAFRLPPRKLNPGQRVVYYGLTSHLPLEDSGETVRLTNARGLIVDAYTYPAVLQADVAWCRIRDGIGYWQDNCFPTPGLENSLTGSLPAASTPGPAAACQLPDISPADFRSGECDGFGQGIWNQQYWDNLAGQQEFVVPDRESKSITYIQ